MCGLNHNTTFLCLDLYICNEVTSKEVLLVVLYFKQKYYTTVDGLIIPALETTYLIRNEVRENY